jgi:hypothetical protein
MALEIRDRVKETCTGTSGDMALTGAVSGFVGFDLDATLDGDTIYYALEDADGTKWEVGLGTLSADSTSIARTTILATQVSFTDTTRQTFSGGTHTIFGTYPASKAVFLDASGNLSHTVDISSDTNLVAGTGITLTGDTLSTTDGDIVHDNLSGFVANEHLDWTTDRGSTNIHAGNYTDTNTMGSGFTVSATTDTNATTITEGDDLMFTAGTGITCETTADGTVTITNTVSDTNTTYTAGDGLDLGGTEFSVDLKANGGLVIESTEIAVDLGASSITGTLAVGDGGTGLTSIATLLNSNVTPTSLSLVIGTNTQAWDAQLDTLAALTANQVGGLVDLATLEAPASDGQFIVATGSGAFAYESGATARTSLGVDAAGTDNSTNVTLVTSSHDYLSLSTQAITLGPIDLAADVTGTLPVGSVSTITLGTNTAGNYVGTITGGTGITSTGATTGEGIAHSLSVDASQTQITAVGTLTGLTIASASASEPILNITNTHAGATSGELRFNKDSASGDDSDVMGLISFYGTDAGEATHERLAYVDAIITDSAAGSEAASLRFYVAENDATLTQGLLIAGQADDDGEVDVTIGAGAASTTTIAGTLTMGSTSALTNAGLVAVANQSNITGLGTIATGTWEGTTIAVDQGGTGQTSYTNGQLLIGNSTGNTLAKATLTAGDNVTITNGTGTITIAATDTNTTYTKASFDVDHLFTLVGASADTAEHLGTFTGSTIADNQTIKAAIQAVETAVETKGVTAGSSSIVTVGALDSGSITSGFGTIATGDTISGSTITASTALKTLLIEYTDGDDAITIHDGGSISMAKAVFHPIANAAAEPEDATVNIDLRNANYFDVELGANVTDIDFTHGKVGQRFMIRFEQDASANYTIAWNAVTMDFDGGGSAVAVTVSWPGGTAPTMTATNDKADTYGFVIRAEGHMDGFVIGQNIPVNDN